MYEYISNWVYTHVLLHFFPKHTRIFCLNISKSIRVCLVQILFDAATDFFQLLPLHQPQIRIQLDVGFKNNFNIDCTYSKRCKLCVVFYFISIFFLFSYFCEKGNIDSFIPEEYTSCPGNKLFCQCC